MVHCMRAQRQFHHFFGHKSIAASTTTTTTAAAAFFLPLSWKKQQHSQRQLFHHHHHHHHGNTRRSSSIKSKSSSTRMYNNYSKKSSYLAMWGEDDNAIHRSKMVQIPNSSSSSSSSSSSFSSNAATGNARSSSITSGGSDSGRQLRPTRRGRGGATSVNDENGGGGGSSSGWKGGGESRNQRGGGWYDDDASDYNDNHVGRRQQQQQQKTRGKKEEEVVSNSGGGGGWYIDDNEDVDDDDNTFRRGGSGVSGRRRYNDDDDDGFRGRGDGRGRGRGDGRGRGSSVGRGGSGRRFDSNRGGGGNTFSSRDGRDRRQGQREALSTIKSISTGAFGASSSPSIGKINLKAIENAGYEHLYGIAPVLNALKAKVRNLSSSDSDSDDDTDENRKRLLELVDGFDNDDEYNDKYDNSERPKIPLTKSVKPEAKLSPHLFVQEGMFDTHSLGNSRSSSSNSRKSSRSNSKKEASLEIITLTQKYNNDDDDDIHLPIVEVDKGVLNTLSGNRPHQGFVLRCGRLDFEPIGKLPLPPKIGQKVSGGNPQLWLALDEVVDPQNLGALLRSAYFLGRGAGIIADQDDYHTVFSDVDERRRGKVGILVCSKNSSPLTPTVSAASAGALEFMTIYSTTNLPKLLNNAKDDGWRVLGAAAADANSIWRGNRFSQDDDEIEEDDGNSSSWDLGDNDNTANPAEELSTTQQKKIVQQPRYFELDEVETGYPTILVLGSEGRGLRTLVARACTGFVSIPGGGGVAVASGGAGVVDEDDNNCEMLTQAGVDSLNVSVTGGILLWQFLSKH